jgi:hypothetical protein
MLRYAAARNEDFIQALTQGRRSGLDRGVVHAGVPSPSHAPG